MLQLASLSLTSASLVPPTLCTLQHLSFSQNWSYVSSRPYLGHICCWTKGLAQHKVHRIRSAIPKFLFAAWALTLLCHEEFNQLIWVNQVKWDKRNLIWVNQVKWDTRAQLWKTREQKVLSNLSWTALTCSFLEFCLPHVATSTTSCLARLTRAAASASSASHISRKAAHWALSRPSGLASHSVVPSLPGVGLPLGPCFFCTVYCWECSQQPQQDLHRPSWAWRGTLPSTILWHTSAQCRIACPIVDA